ncbi:tetratricopeptide repeat protein [Paenibacillus sp. Z6-24]
MSKIFLFSILWWLLGNPFLALLVILFIVYVLDRRFVGISPSLVRPLRRLSRIRSLRRLIAGSPSDMSSRYELARLLMERKRHREALGWLEQIGHAYADSAEYWDDLGTCQLHTGQQAEGERHILQALDINPRVKYGEPYLRLASEYIGKDQERALHYLEQFRSMQSSSCRAYYMLGMLDRSLGHTEAARSAFDEGVSLYRFLPKYKKRSERGWAFRSWLRRIFST